MPPKKAEGITERGTVLLDTLRQQGKFMSKNDLAEVFGKRRLNPHESRLIDWLAENGYLEMSQETRGISLTYLYRAVKGKE